MPKRLSNVQQVTQIMNFSEFGALAQLFVMDALTKHANAISSMTEEDMQSDEWKNSFIDAKLWRDVAREIKEKLNSHSQN